MSYKTPVKSLRYGLASDWYYKGSGTVKNSLLAEKIGQYVGNLITFVVPPAPKKTRTKGMQIKKPPVQPGIQGRTVVMDTPDSAIVLVYFYLNYVELNEEQSNALEINFNRLLLVTFNELGGAKIFFCNYFDFFFFTDAFTNSKGIAKHIKKKITTFYQSVPETKIALLYGKAKLEAFQSIRNGVARFRRQQYMKRSLKPMAAAFFFSDCDSDLLTRVIAFELQILRVFHRKFLNFIRAFFKVWIADWSDAIRMTQGIQIEIRGRLTLFRRQIRRTSTRIFRYGIIKRSQLTAETGSSRALAFNRYGIISVNLHYQLKPRFFVSEEDHNPYFPLRIFSLHELRENNSFFFLNKKIQNKTNFFNINKHWVRNRRDSRVGSFVRKLSKAPGNIKFYRYKNQSGLAKKNFFHSWKKWSYFYTQNKIVKLISLVTLSTSSNNNASKCIYS
jgi:hypothetical protein